MSWISSHHGYISMSNNVPQQHLCNQQVSETRFHKTYKNTTGSFKYIHSNMKINTIKQDMQNMYLFQMRETLTGETERTVESRR